MKPHVVALLVVIASTGVVAGCGTASDVAVDAPDVSASGTPEPHPTAAPWPRYDVDDYTYTLRTTCFCSDGGSPVVVTVRHGRVTDAVYAHGGPGHAAGDPAPRWMRATVNDVIAAANDQHADKVHVRWPQGQDYPRSVWVDPDQYAADEEIAYTITDVDPT